MNHVKTYPGEGTRRLQNWTVLRPDCLILAGFDFITFGNESCTDAFCMFTS